MVDAFFRIATEEGIRSLYRGVFPAFLLTSHGAIQLVVYPFRSRIYLDCPKITCGSYEQLKRLKSPEGPSAALALAYGSARFQREGCPRTNEKLL